MIEQALALFFESHNLRPNGENTRSYIFDCPACDGKKKLYIEKSTGRSKCFRGDSDRCPSSGNPVFALSLITGLHSDIISKEIFDHTPVVKKDEDFKISFEKKEKIIDGIKAASGDDIPLDFIPIFDSASDDGVKYMESRGITKEIVIELGLLYSPILRRVIFPVIMNNIMYGWQGRSIDPVDKAYRMYNMPGPWKAKTLMFHQNLNKSKFAILAEGPISAMKFHKVGGYIASMGKEISKEQLELIRVSGIKRLYLALDRDAVDKMQSIYGLMRGQLNNPIECYVIDIPKHRDDFGDCTFEECEEAFKSSMPLNPDKTFVDVIKEKMLTNKKK